MSGIECSTDILPDFENGRFICIGRSDALNVVFITGTNKFSLSFNLEKVSKNKALDVVNELSSHLSIDYSEIDGDPLDYSLVVDVSDASDNDIINALNTSFNMTIPRVA